MDPREAKADHSDYEDCQESYQTDNSDDESQFCDAEDYDVQPLAPPLVVATATASAAHISLLRQESEESVDTQGSDRKVGSVVVDEQEVSNCADWCEPQVQAERGSAFEVDRETKTACTSALPRQQSIHGLENGTSNCVSNYQISSSLEEQASPSRNREGQQTASTPQPVAPDQGADSGSVSPALGDTIQLDQALDINKHDVDEVECELSEEKRKQLLNEAEALKAAGNTLYGSSKFQEAKEKYLEALGVAPPDALQQQAVYLANIAACDLKLDQPKLACQHCTRALQLQPDYVKALMRRGAALEQQEELEQALGDAKRVLELDAGNSWAERAVARLGPKVAERQERLKEEMLGKLKDLGNNLLGRFGMSLDNFKAEKDPNTGGFSLSYNPGR